MMKRRAFPLYFAVTLMLCLPLLVLAQSNQKSPVKRPTKISAQVERARSLWADVHRIVISASDQAFDTASGSSIAFDAKL